jgi:hypothetical protein
LAILQDPEHPVPDQGGQLVMAERLQWETADQVGLEQPPAIQHREEGSRLHLRGGVLVRGVVGESGLREEPQSLQERVLGRHDVVDEILQDRPREQPRVRACAAGDHAVHRLGQIRAVLGEVQTA